MCINKLPTCETKCFNDDSPYAYRDLSHPSIYEMLVICIVYIVFSYFPVSSCPLVTQNVLSDELMPFCSSSTESPLASVREVAKITRSHD